MNKVQLLNTLISRSTNQSTRLLYLLIKHEHVTEEMAENYNINNIYNKVNYLQTKGWTIARIDTYTYKLILT